MGAESIFSPRNSLLIDSRSSALNCTHKGAYTVVHSRTAGQLTRRTQNAPKFLAAGDSCAPNPTWGSSQRFRKPSTWWGGAVSPHLSKNPGTLAQPFGLRVSVLLASPRPRNVDFVPTPLAVELGKTAMACSTLYIAPARMR